MRKRLKSGIILAIAIAMLMAFPLVGNAADDYKEWTSDNSLPESGTYKLMNDVTVETTFSDYVKIQKELTVDLNGHSIVFEGDGSYGFFVYSKGNLTIEDSVGTGKITNAADGPGTLIQVNGGKATFKGGTIVNTIDRGQTLFINSDNGSVVLDGATIENKAKDESTIFINGGNNDIGASFEMLSGTVKCATTYASEAAIYANNGANAIKISGGTIESATVGVHAAFTPVTVTGGTIDAAGHAFHTRNTTIEEADGSEVVVKSGKSLFYTFRGSDNKVKGGDFQVAKIESAYSSEEPSVTTIDAGTFNVDPSAYVTNAENGVVGAGSDKFVAGTEDDLNAAVAQMIADGATAIEITKGDVALDVDTDGITFTNTGDGKVTVNNQEIGETPVKIHVHSAVKTEAKEVTCTENGNIAYWYCADCDKYFSDEALTQVITEEETVVKTEGHKFDDRGKCTVCGVLTPDAEEANKVDALIDAIGPADQVTLDSYDTIMAAKKAFEALTAEQQALVTGLDDLNAAIDAYNALVDAQTEDPKDEPSDKPIDKPDKNDGDDKEDGKSPQTGDNTNPMLILGLLLASAGAAVALRRKTAK